MKKKIDSTLFTSILYIVVGVLLAVMPGELLKWAMVIAGAFFILSGVLELIKQNWVGGIISLVIGVVIILGGWLFLEIVLLVLGVLIALKGVVALINAIKYNTTVLGLLFPILTIIAGVGLAFALGSIRSIVCIVVGIFLAINGIIGLIGALTK